MRQSKVLAASVALAAVLAAPAAFGCADGGCEIDWKLSAQELNCASRGFLSPANDTRINLLLLLRDRGGLGMAGLKHEAVEYADHEGGDVFWSWRQLNMGLFPGQYDYWSGFGSKEGDRSGSRCVSLAGGDAGFNAAVAANRALSPAERERLLAGRGMLADACDGKEPAASRTLPTFTTPMATAFGEYLQAAEAFYREDWARAGAGFAGLARSSDPWLAETAVYMAARTALNAGQAAAVSEYGWFEGTEKVDQRAVRAAGAGFNAYLKAWPNGRYAASAKGLQRRVAYLSGDRAGLAKTYAAMLGSVDTGGPTATLLVQEVDNKLIADPQEEAAAEGPMLLAMLDLMQMRPTYDGSADDGEGAPKLTAAALEAQAPQFASDKPLFDFLRATHAFHVAKDYRRVLTLLPDDARQSSFSNLAFSRQVLRGMALAALKDRNEGGFWQELLSGSKGVWQRSTVQLGLAMNWERAGKVDTALASGSPVSDPTIRQVLIINSASAPLLRRVVQDRANPATERDQALDTLLTNQLVRGQFAAFAADTKLPLADPKANAAMFTTGKVGDGYPCARIAVTAAALAKNLNDIPGRLCLGDFFRINGLDYFQGEYYRAPKPDELGGAVRGFSGARLNRSTFYTAIIADPRAATSDKAYALYRAVMCYAPSGSNDCGGAGVPVSQRQAWFQRLKRDYPASQWAKKLRVYW